jgi:hypothetical protein
MPKHRAKGRAGPVGWAPLAIVVFLLMAALSSLFMGRTALQFGVRLAIVGGVIGLLYVGWYELAKHHSEFAMGSGGESTIVLLIVATGLLFWADPVANSVGMALIPNYSQDRQLALVGSGSMNFDNATGIIAFIFIVIALASAILLVFLLTRSEK